MRHFVVSVSIVLAALLTSCTTSDKPVKANNNQTETKTHEKLLANLDEACNNLLILMHDEGVMRKNIVGMNCLLNASVDDKIEAIVGYEETYEGFYDTVAETDEWCDYVEAKKEFWASKCEIVEYCAL